MEDNIKTILDKIRPSLKADGGDVEFVGSFGLIHYTHRTLHHPARRQQGDKPPHLSSTT